MKATVSRGEDQHTEGLTVISKFIAITHCLAYSQGRVDTFQSHLQSLTTSVFYQSSMSLQGKNRERKGSEATESL